MIIDFSGHENYNEFEWNSIIITLKTIFDVERSSKPGVLYINNADKEILEKVKQSVESAFDKHFSLCKNNFTIKHGEKKLLPMIQSEFLSQWNDIAYAYSILKSHSMHSVILEYFFDLRMHWYKDLSENIDKYHNSKYLITIVDTYMAQIKFFEFKNYITKNNKYEIKEKNIIDFVIKCIDDNQYPAVVVDEYYITNCINYQKMHNSLRKLFYGYDFEKRILYYIGFNERHIYTNLIMTFDECIEAYERNKIIGYDYGTYIETYKLKSKVSNKQIDTQKITNKINNYLESRKSEFDLLCETIDCNLEDNIQKIPGLSLVNSDFNCAYGLSIYDKLIDFLEMEKNIKKVPLYQNIHALYEHKKILLTNIEYINKFVKNIPSETIENMKKAVKHIESARLICLRAKAFSPIDKISREIDLIIKHIKECKRYEVETLLNIKSVLSLDK